jgi:membrane protease subunit (stomatin/prohibitin family)
MGMGAGLAMGQILAQNMQSAFNNINSNAAPQASVAAPAPVPAPASISPDEVMATLEKLGDLKAKGILTQEEFDAKKSELLKKLT